MNRPEVVDRLAILNAAHPRKLSQGLHHPGQLRKSWYFFFFDLPDLPEALVHANHWHFFRHFLHDAHPAYTPEEIDRYVEAWSQPGAAAGMINYYRSSVRIPPKQADAAIRPIKAPTLLIWGQRDRYLGEELAEPDHDDVPNLDRVERLPDASHWVHHDEAENVTQLLTGFSPPPCQPRTDQVVTIAKIRGRPAGRAASRRIASPMPSRSHSPSSTQVPPSCLDPVNSRPSPAAAAVTSRCRALPAGGVLVAELVPVESACRTPVRCPVSWCLHCRLGSKGKKGPVLVTDVSDSVGYGSWSPEV
jgi:hypothetical protein